MRGMRIFCLIVAVFSLNLLPVYAQVDSNDFRIQVAGPADTEPPSTPTLLSAEPITFSQIDLAWTAATDNAAVAGYVVVRDGNPIATTTLLTYADTTLVASITYTYHVRAFDPSLNYSSSSNSLATTTPDEPPPPIDVTDSSTESGTIARVVLRDFSILTGWSTSTFALTTAHPARLELRWGRSASYELGYVVSGVYSREHEIRLAELEPGTTYEYEVIGYTPAGYGSVLKRGTFTTLSQVEERLPANVGRFTATAEGTDVALRWEIPPAVDLAYVRVVRSHLGFPEHPQDGAIVYQGEGEGARDRGILARYSPVYYTAFGYDQYGNVSSGAIAIVYAADTEDGAAERPKPPVTPIGSIDTPAVEATSTVVTERLTVDMKLPKLSDLSLVQPPTRFTFTEPTITLAAETGFSISVPRAAVAGNLKSLIATVVDPTDNRQRYSYLLRINKDRTAYEAEIAPLMVSGTSQIVVEIFDYEAMVVGTYQTPVTFVPAPTATEEVLFPDILFIYWPVTLLVGGGLLGLFFLIFFLVRRSHEDEDNQA